jgi:hypothetical protein
MVVLCFMLGLCKEETGSRRCSIRLIIKDLQSILFLTTLLVDDFHSTRVFSGNEMIPWKTIEGIGKMVDTKMELGEDRERGGPGRRRPAIRYSIL